MGEGYSMLGFVVIVILYAVIGLMAAAGTIVSARKIPGPKAEQIFCAMFLIMFATFYLAFTAYFEVATAWRVETGVVVAFVAIGLLGVRLSEASRVAGIGHISSHSFRNAYRTWIDALGTPVGVQQRLMRHASVTTTMNLYGTALQADMRAAHENVVAQVSAGFKVS